VAVLNPKLIPASLDVVVGDHYFELGFEVEKIGVDENGEEAVFEWSGEEAGEGKGEKGDKEFSPRKEELEREAKRHKYSSTIDGLEGKAAGSETCFNANDLSTFKEKVSNMNEEEFRMFLKEKAEEIMDLAADRVLEEIADKVMGEEVFPTAVSGGFSGFGEEGEGGATADGMHLTENHAENSMESNKRMERAAMIPEATMPHVRSSPRLSKSKDEHTLIRAEERAAKKNLELPGGMPRTEPCSSLLFDVASSNLQQLGINFGSGENDRIRNLQQLFDLDAERAGVELGEGELFWAVSDSEEEDVETLEIDALKCLCGDLMEEVFEVDSFYLSSAEKTTSRKYKSRAKSRLKKTCKIVMSNYSKSSIK